MNKYMATFHSHFGAMSYFRDIKKRGIMAKLMPVPRKVSSTCGICVCYEHDSAIDADNYELDCVYLESADGYDCIIKK